MVVNKLHLDILDMSESNLLSTQSQRIPTTTKLGRGINTKAKQNILF